MDTNNVVRLNHARSGRGAPAQVTFRHEAQLVRSRDIYRRLYDRNTARLAVARIEVATLQERVRSLERELAAHHGNASMVLLQEAVKLMAGMSADRQQFDRAMGGVVRMPAATLEFTSRGEALVSRAAPLLPPDAIGECEVPA